jgi:hypothetical protein
MGRVDGPAPGKDGKGRAGGESGGFLSEFPSVDGTPERTRTSGLLLRRQALYPLSYGRATTLCSIAQMSFG